VLDHEKGESAADRGFSQPDSAPGSEKRAVEVEPAVGRVAVVVTPFASTQYPSLDAGQMHAACSGAGWQSRLEYLNHRCAAWIGREIYDRIASHQRSVGVGEWVGAAPLRSRAASFPQDVLDQRRWGSFADYLINERTLPASEVAALEAASEAMSEFVDIAAALPFWQDTDLVLLCCKHQQLGFSLSLAQALRQNLAETYPDLPIYLFGEMVNSWSQAQAVCDAAPWIDGVLVRAPATIAQNRLDDLRHRRTVPGVAVKGGSPAEEKLARALPVTPDFGDFYDRYTKDPIESVLPVQTSVGCWWADRHHCTFCGLVEENRQYLSKSPDEIVNEFVSQIEKYESLRLVATDLLLDYKYFKSVVPKLKELDIDIDIFFEIKADLNKGQLIELRDAGINNLQAGIESFDQTTLDGMDKGTSVFQNIRFMKWCTELGINLNWIQLYGFPRETAETMDAQAELLKRLCHLQPPIGIAAVRVERGSPFFKDPGAHGMRIEGPSECNLHTYPFDLNIISAVAKEFRHGYTDDRDVEAQSTRLRAVAEAWRRDWRPDTLYYKRGVDFLKICDFRGPERVVTLRGWHARLYELLDTQLSESRLLSLLVSAGESVDAASIRETLDDLNQLGLVYGADGRWLALAPRVSRMRPQPGGATGSWS